MSKKIGSAFKSIVSHKLEILFIAFIVTMVSSPLMTAKIAMSYLSNPSAGEFIQEITGVKDLTAEVSGLRQELHDKEAQEIVFRGEATLVSILNGAISIRDLAKKPAGRINLLRALTFPESRAILNRNYPSTELDKILIQIRSLR